MADWYLETHGHDTDLSMIKELKEYRNYTVGRKRHFDIVSINPLVSRDHGLFKHKRDNHIYVHDTNSSNGIWVNDIKIQPNQDQLLQENDIIGLGAPSTATGELVELFKLCNRHVIEVSDSDSSMIDKVKEENKCSLQNQKEEHVPSSSKTIKNKENGPSTSKIEDAIHTGINESQEINIGSSSLLTKSLCALETKNEGVLQGNDNKDMLIHVTFAINKCGCHISCNNSTDRRLVIGDTCVKCSSGKLANEISSRPFQRDTKPEKQSLIYKTLDLVTISSSEDENDDIISRPNQSSNTSHAISNKSPERKHEHNAPECKQRSTETSESDQCAIGNMEPDTNSDITKDNSNQSVNKEKPNQISVPEKDNVDKVPNVSKSNKDSNFNEDRGNMNAMVVFKKLECISPSSSSDEEEAIHTCKKKMPVIYDSSDTDNISKVDQRSKKKRKPSSPDETSLKSSKSSTKNTLKSSSHHNSNKNSKKQPSVASKSLNNAKHKKSSINVNDEQSIKQKRIGKEMRKSIEERPSSGERSKLKEKKREKSSSREKRNSTDSSNSKDKQLSGEKLKKDKRKSTDFREKSKSKEKEMGTEKSVTNNKDKVESRGKHKSNKRPKSKERSQENSTSENNNNNSDKHAAINDVSPEESVAVPPETLLVIQEASSSVTPDSSPVIESINSSALDQNQPSTSNSDADQEWLIPKQEIKCEPNSISFGENSNTIEVICLSDDDDIFPRSQLFNDPVEVTIEAATSQDGLASVAVKLETLCQNAGEDVVYPAIENNDNIFGIIKVDVDFDDSAVDVDEEDDDESFLWYSKLSQSQFPLPQKIKIDESNNSTDETCSSLNFLNDKELIINEQNESVNDEGQPVVSRGDRSPNDSLIRSVSLVSLRPPPAACNLESAARQSENAKEIICPAPSTVTAVLKPEHTVTKEQPANSGQFVPSICTVVGSTSPSTISPTTVAEPEPATDELDTTVKLDDKPLNKPDSSAKKTYVKPPVIDPPALVKGRRKTTEKPKPKELGKRGRKRKQSNEELPQVPATTATAVNAFGTGKNLDKSLKNELDKRHKRRRASTDSLPKEKKQEIREERMKKLKELAKKNVDDKQDKLKTKNTKKPYVKISNSRGLFLTDEESVREAEKRKNPAMTPSEHEPKSKIKFTIPKKKPNEINKVLEEVNKVDASSTSKDNNCNVQSDRPGIISNNNSVNATQKENLNGVLKKRVKKHVTFNDIPVIRVFEIVEGNNMNKCTSKDAPLPKKSTAAVTREPATNDNTPENMALLNILSWIPNWLEMCKNQPFVPRVSVHKPIQMLHTFNTYGDYCNIVLPLLLLELWAGVIKDWSLSRNRVMFANVEDAGNFTMCNTCMLSINGSFPITRTENETQAHPVRGDLVIMEMLLSAESNKYLITNTFGYVANIYKRKVRESDFVGKGALPQGKFDNVVHFNVILRKFNGVVNQDTIMRIRGVSRIGPSLRIFKSVTMMKQSALCSFILNPSIKDYIKPKLNETKLVIEDKLDADQLRCMLEACQVCTRPEPGIYMIEGPPGTGKSRVIKNIVQQLLYCERKPGMKPNCILLCAPSNGAIDELSMKLLDMRQSLPQEKRFKMVRLGPPNSIHPKVKRISLPTLVETFVKRQLEYNMADNEAVLEDLNFRQLKINTLENKLQSFTGNESDKIEVAVQLQRAKLDLALFHNRSKRELTFQEMKTLERESEVTVINKADIVCTTLSSCVGSRMEELFHKKLLHFTCCIVDEATQSNEQETLIPLILGINKLILVGDPAQLPATVLSNDAKALGYGNSLFYRIQKCLEHLPENPIRMLKTQYRMHPEICKFPNEHFYYGKLITYSDTRESNSDRGSGALPHRYRVFALLPSSRPQQRSADVYLNVPEAHFVLFLAKAVLKHCADYTIGIITPYTRQREFLQRRLDEITKETEQESDRVSVNTVDGFQGQERDVIIISCVRHSSNLFLANEQRLNVSLTRAKHALFICAQSHLFKNDDIWTKLAQDATRRACIQYLLDQEYKNEQYVTSLICKTNLEIPTNPSEN